MLFDVTVGVTLFTLPAVIYSPETDLTFAGRSYLSSLFPACATRFRAGSSDFWYQAGMRPISTAGLPTTTQAPSLMAGSTLHRLRRACLMLYRRRVIPPRLEELWGLTPRLAEALARKESCDCSHCGAKLRGRRLAQVMLALYPAGSPPAPAPSLARWVELPEIQKMRVAEINRIDGVHEQIRRWPRAPSLISSRALARRDR